MSGQKSTSTYVKPYNHTKTHTFMSTHTHTHTHWIGGNHTAVARASLWSISLYYLCVFVCVSHVCNPDTHKTIVTTNKNLVIVHTSERKE